MELQIRKMVPDDYEPLYKLLSDPEVMKYLEPPFSETKTKQFLLDAGLCDPPLVYAVDLQNQFIGYVIYHAYDEKSVEIGWVLLPEYWEKGYALELTRIVIGKAKDNHKDVVIECAPQQSVTQKIAAKYGFTYCGRSDNLDVFRLLI